MADIKRTTLSISTTTRDRLKQEAQYHESLEGVILKLLDLSDKLKRQRNGNGKFTKSSEVDKHE